MNKTKYLFILLLFCSCSNDYRISLPNNFWMVREYSESVFISDKDQNIIIHPHIQRYAIEGEIIVGLVVKTDEFQKSTPGYFLLDTTKNAVYQGLDKNELENELKNYNIKEIPKLKRVTYFSKILK